MRTPCGCPPKRTFSARGHESLQNGVADGPDDFQLPIFLTERDRVKQREGFGTTPWALRSVHAGLTRHFCLVYSSGNPSNDDAHASWAVAPGFDI